MNRRNTIQRELVLNAVRKLKCHATADEVYSEVAKEHPGIGKGTIYRNLNILAEEGEIRKVEFPGGPERFDHICKSHYHVRCISCRALFDVDMEVIPDLKDRITDSHGILFLDYDVMFKGVCPKCQANADDIRKAAK